MTLWAPPKSYDHMIDRRKRLNVALLMGGYVVGQGGIFAAQTALLAREQLELLATFGSAFSFAILGTIVVDLGALTALARETARGDTRRIWARYWSLTACRLVVGVAVAAMAAGYALLAADPFLRAYAIWALPVALLWSFNAAGVLDGLRLSGANGIAGSAPYLCSAVALLAASHGSPEDAGSLLGSALTLGYALTLVGQYAGLRRAGIVPRFVRPDTKDIMTAGRDGSAVLFATLPGQLYFRFQVLLANAVLGPAGTALFVYAKQVATACAQVIGFVRRAEFPDLVSGLAAVSRDRARITFDAQRTGTWLGAAAAAAMIVGGIAGAAWLPGAVGAAAATTAMFGPVVLAGALGSALVLGLQASGRYGTAAGVMVLSVAAGVAVNASAIVWPEVAVFALADVAVYAVALILSRAVLLAERMA